MKTRTWWASAIMVLIGAASSGGSTACTLEQIECACPTYACGNEAKLTGKLAVPKDAGAARVKFCKGADCVGGPIDLSQVGAEPTCVGDGQVGIGDVCVTRDSAGDFQVEASLVGQDNDVPPDGELYTLAVMDEESGDVLLEETRAADYVITREDCCHRCWHARMNL